jgi:hypothetical protein
VFPFPAFAIAGSVKLTEVASDMAAVNAKSFFTEHLLVHDP